MTRLKWFFLVFLRYYRNLGLRVLLYAGLALAVAFISPLAAQRVNDLVALELTFDSVVPVLTILASSMLAVSTFSLNIMVSAHRAAASATTPRVHRLLMENTTTQSVLATFIGAFVYSLTSIILYRSNFYAEQAAVLVMGVTILVAALVVASLLRWIHLLKDLGSVDESINTAKERAMSALESLAHLPHFGALPLTDKIRAPQDALRLKAQTSGVLQLIDISRLETCLPEGAAIYILTHPGRHVLKGETIAEVVGTVDDTAVATASEAFIQGAQRTYEQDVEFGLTVLAEIASRALSPGINDPGTAIQTVSALTEVLWQYAQTPPDYDAHRAQNVFVRAPRDADLVEAAFAAIARDGAANVEVVVALREALQKLTQCDRKDLAEASRDMAAFSMTHAEGAGLLEVELKKVHSVKVDER